MSEFDYRNLAPVPDQDMSPPDGYGTGLVVRDYSVYPVGYNAKAFDIPIIPVDKRQAALDALVASKAQLHNIRDRSGPNGAPIPSRDQGSRGYCWSHSTVSAMLLARAVQGEPYADLSAYAIACIIKNYRDEGGWGSASLEWAAEHGCPTSEFWPQQSVSRSNDNAAMRENAKKHRVTEWMDLQPRNKEQLITCLLLNIPVVSDFNWWGHSVCTVALLSLNPFRTLIWNSWGDRWQQNGMGVLEGSKAIPDGMIAPRVLMGG